MGKVIEFKNIKLEKFLKEVEDIAKEYKIKKIAVIMSDETDWVEMYYKMRFEDKINAKTHLEIDILDQQVRANTDRYCNCCQ